MKIYFHDKKKKKKKKKNNEFFGFSRATWARLTFDHSKGKIGPNCDITNIINILLTLLTLSFSKRAASTVVTPLLLLGL